MFQVTFYNTVNIIITFLVGIPFGTIVIKGIVNKIHETIRRW